MKKFNNKQDEKSANKTLLAMIVILTLIIIIDYVSI